MNRPNHKILLSLILITLFIIPAAAAQQRPNRFAIDGERIKEYVNWLSQPELNGRKSGAPGYQTAAEWVADQYDKWGLTPGGPDGSYFQQVPIRPFSVNLGTPELIIDNRTFYIQDGNFTIGANNSTVDTTIDVEIVFVGHGISAPDKGLDEYADVNVKGKVALVLKGNPHDAPAPTGGRFNPGNPKLPDLKDDLTTVSTDSYKITTAYDKGASGILLYDPAASTTTAAPRGRRGAGASSMELNRKFLTFTIQQPIFNYIMRTDPQETNRGLQRRIDAYRRQIKKGIPSSKTTGVYTYLKGYEEVINYGADSELLAPNVIAKIEGTDPDLKDEIVLVGGHLDHLGIRDGIVYNGADDNASGSAVTMETARLLHNGNFKPKRTILFCCWVGEEIGTVGSRFFIDNPYDDVTVDKVVTYLNMDMVGVGDVLTVPGAFDYPEIWDVIKRDLHPDFVDRVLPSLTTRLSSDHAGFLRQGVMGLGLQTRQGVGHLDYHQPEDDVEKIQPEALRLTGEFVMQATMNLANETETELIIPNRKEIYISSQTSRDPTITNFNPELEGSIWTNVAVIEAENKIDLQFKLLERALNQQTGQGGRRQASGPITQGVGNKDLKVFENDAKVLSIASRMLGFGRVDVTNSDGFMIANGRLTNAGKGALKALEDAGIAVHLMSPSEDLVYDVLEEATKPFIITGSYTINEDMFDKINEKNVLIGINFKVGEEDDCIERLDLAREYLGDSDNLVILTASSEDLADAARKLQIGFMKAGWKFNEIDGRNSGVLGGNLSKLSGR
ncbi:MAG: M20/M25/M40 family metallo-hydrolase [Planctomycetes bacterium]|nr:M20/M25/M40 family metallo-hydrolase [Planctomycetota bacterium]